MGILDQYKRALEEEEKQNMDFPSETNLTEKDKDAYEAALKKMRNAEFSEDEVNEAIKNSRKNMKDFDEEHNGGANETAMHYRLTKLTDAELVEKGLLKSDSISDIKIIRAYCPKCGKELKADCPPMYNPFTLEKVCRHVCCGEVYNLDKTFPHIAIYDKDGEEIITFM